MSSSKKGKPVPRKRPPTNIERAKKTVRKVIIKRNNSLKAKISKYLPHAFEWSGVENRIQLIERMTSYVGSNVQKHITKSRKKYYAGLSDVYAMYCVLLELTDQEKIDVLKKLSSKVEPGKRQKSYKPMHMLLEAFVDYAEGGDLTKIAQNQLARDARALMWAHRNHVLPTRLVEQLNDSGAGLEAWARSYTNRSAPSPRKKEASGKKVERTATSLLARKGAKADVPLTQSPALHFLANAPKPPQGSFVAIINFTPKLNRWEVLAVERLTLTQLKPSRARAVINDLSRAAPQDLAKLAHQDLDDIDDIDGDDN